MFPAADIRTVQQIQLAQVLHAWIGDIDPQRILDLSGRSNFSTGLTLPHAQSSLQLVLWSHGPSRCAGVQRALHEIARVLAPQGRLLLHDYLVPGSRLRGKKARRERDAGHYINLWTRLRGQEHYAYYAVDDWVYMLAQAGLRSIETETEQRIVEFADWLGDRPRQLHERQRLEAMLLQAPQRVEAFLTPMQSTARITFQGTEFFILAELSNQNP